MLLLSILRSIEHLGYSCALITRSSETTSHNMPAPGCQRQGNDVSHIPLVLYKLLLLAWYTSPALVPKMGAFFMMNNVSFSVVHNSFQVADSSLLSVVTTSFCACLSCKTTPRILLSSCGGVSRPCLELISCCRSPTRLLVSTAARA